MAKDKKQTTEPAHEPDRLRLEFLLAEVSQMRRVESYTPEKGAQSYYECNLCHGRSEDAFGKIEHRTGCPLLSLK
jgi:hypothetical protein